MIFPPIRRPGGAPFIQGARALGFLAMAAVGIVLTLRTRAPAHSETGSPAASPRRKLIYAGDAYFPPFEYRDEKGQAQGFNVQLVKVAAEEAGFDVEFRLGPWADAVGSLETGKAGLLGRPE